VIAKINIIYKNYSNNKKYTWLRKSNHYFNKINKNEITSLITLISLFYFQSDFLSVFNNFTKYALKLFLFNSLILNSISH